MQVQPTRLLPHTDETAESEIPLAQRGEPLRAYRVPGHPLSNASIAPQLTAACPRPLLSNRLASPPPPPPVLQPGCDAAVVRRGESAACIHRLRSALSSWSRTVIQHRARAAELRTRVRMALPRLRRIRGLRRWRTAHRRQRLAQVNVSLAHCWPPHDNTAASPNRWACYTRCATFA